MHRLNIEFIRTDTRGSLIQVNTGEWQQLNYLIIKEGNKFGEHYHKYKKELFYMTKGEAKVQIINKKGSEHIYLKKGGCLLIEPYDHHTINAVKDCEIVELLSTPYDPQDIWIE